MGWRDKYKRRRRGEDPAMVEVQRLKNSVVQGSQTDRNKTLVRADELDGVDVRQNLVKDGGPQGSPSGRALFHLAPGAKRVTFDNVRLTGSGFDTLVSGADAEYLVVNGCSMETGAAPPQPSRRTGGVRPQPSRRTIFLPPSVPSVPSREQQRHSGKFIGRNEPCPCESGRKYKHCHGKIT
jgi:hypothetical protein